MIVFIITNKVTTTIRIVMDLSARKITIFPRESLDFFLFQIESKSKIKSRGSSKDRFGSSTGAVLLLEIIYGMLML